MALWLYPGVLYLLFTTIGQPGVIVGSLSTIEQTGFIWTEVAELDKD
jgi:hypothetical protein